MFAMTGTALSLVASSSGSGMAPKAQSTRKLPLSVRKAWPLAVLRSATLPEAPQAAASRRMAARVASPPKRLTDRQGEFAERSDGF